MKDLFVTYAIASLLKEKGFKEPCLAKWTLHVVGDKIPHFSYNYYESEGLWFNHNGKDVSNLNGSNSGKDFLWSAPMHQQVIDWFREKHKLHFYIVPFGDGKSWSLCNIGKINTKVDRLDFDIAEKYDNVKFKSYYKTLDKVFEEAFKLI